jgi:hypothetical protein
MNKESKRYRTLLVEQQAKNAQLLIEQQAKMDKLILEQQKDGDKRDWHPLTAKVVEETVRQNGKSIHHISPSLHRSVPAVVGGEYTGAMECITSAAKEVCSYLPGGEDGNAMDLIRHPCEPNSWALALAADRKQVQFVINLHTHIASGLAEKQMAELKNLITIQAIEIADIKIDYANIRTLLETSILGKRAQSDTTNQSDAPVHTLKCSRVWCTNTTTLMVNGKWHKKCVRCRSNCK